MIWSKIEETSFADNETIKFIFKDIHVFIEEEDNPSDKVVTFEEELDGIDVNGIGNLVVLPRLIFIDEECENLKVIVDGG